MLNAFLIITAVAAIVNTLEPMKTLLDLTIWPDTYAQVFPVVNSLPTVLLLTVLLPLDRLPIGLVCLAVYLSGYLQFVWLFTVCLVT